MIRNATLPRARPGITLTEILISVMILGIGLVSLATLFPIGLLRLREAQRQTRSAYLSESATADVAAGGLFNKDSFVYVDLLNGLGPYPYWYLSPLNPDLSGRYNPLTHDTAAYGTDAYDGTNPGASSPASGGYGLPFAYDPLWRYQTGIYLDPVGKTMPEARFASGIGSLLRGESDTLVPSAHGLQRLTNFNRPAVMASAKAVPSIFVSPEDVVWQEASNPNYTVAFSGSPGTPVGTPSTVVPDLSIDPSVQPTNDWRFSWMITAQQTNASNGAAFEGNIVIFENRPFAIDNVLVAGETVYEGVFGHSKNVLASVNYSSYGYGSGADRTVLIRWNASQADPIIKVGNWIADVTYERNQVVVNSRFYFNSAPPAGAARQFTLEWDNLPAQRCFWYQVQKVAPAQPDPSYPGYRSMVVYVNKSLDARTLLDVGTGNPVFQNAVLVCPNVVNVIPQTFFVR